MLALATHPACQPVMQQCPAMGSRERLDWEGDTYTHPRHRSLRLPSERSRAPSPTRAKNRPIPADIVFHREYQRWSIPRPLPRTPRVNRCSCHEIDRCSAYCFLGNRYWVQCTPCAFHLRLRGFVRLRSMFSRVLYANGALFTGTQVSGYSPRDMLNRDVEVLSPLNPQNVPIR